MLEPFWLWLSEIPGVGVPLAVGWTIYIVVIGLWIIGEKREPEATLGWLLALAALPVVGFLIYHLFGPRRIKRQRLKRLRACAALVARAPDDEGDPYHQQIANLAHRTTGWIGRAHV